MFVVDYFLAQDCVRAHTFIAQIFFCWLPRDLALPAQLEDISECTFYQDTCMKDSSLFPTK